MTVGLRVGVWLLAALSGLGAACLLELDGDIACGDGYVDRQAGEQCDPLVESSYADRCLTTDRTMGEAVCDEATCKVLVGIEQCGACGDGWVDAELGEECEEGVPVDVTCPGAGEVTCENCRLVFACDECGNGITEPSESCDFDLSGIKAVPNTCVGLPVPGLPELSYTYGSRRCKLDCTWDLTGCGLCGNDKIDQFEIIDPETGLRIRPPEACDGTRFSFAAVAEECGPLCGSQADGLSCQVQCDVGCLGVTAIDAPDIGCCILHGSPRDPILPCCCELQDDCSDDRVVPPGGVPFCPASTG